MTRIHDVTVDLLGTVGVAFETPEALDTFQKHGVRVDGRTVFLTEREIGTALKTAPERFTLHARNPERSIEIGGGCPAFAPGYGARFIINGDHRRPGTMSDYDHFCKLVQTSPVVDILGFMMVEPGDVAPETAHLDMIFSGMILCDRPFMGSPVSARGMADCLEMARRIWGGAAALIDYPVTLTLINPLSPLRYGDAMTGALMELVRWGQAGVISPFIVSGVTGPASPLGALALQNAEILAGLALAQMIRPGTPIVYGGNLAAGPGLSLGDTLSWTHAARTAQMARFYGLPARCGGSLTDAHRTDLQAGVESALGMLTAAGNGVHLVLQSCGVLSALAAVSYEKFILDETLCRQVKRLISPPADDLDAALGQIRTAGTGGSFEPPPGIIPLDQCRSTEPADGLMVRQPWAEWQTGGSPGPESCGSGEPAAGNL